MLISIILSRYQLKFEFTVYTHTETHTQTHTHTYIYIYNKVSNVGDHSRGQPEGSLFNSYNTEVLGRALFLSLDCSTLHSIRTLHCWVLSMEVSSTILKVFGMTRPGIEPRSTRTIGEHSTHLANEPVLYKHTYGQRERERDTDRQTDRQRNIETGKVKRERQTYRKSDRQTS